MRTEVEVKSREGTFLIRPYRPGDETAILSSWKEAFGQEMTLSHWRWKYPGNPEGFRCLLCLAEDGTVVAHYAAQVTRITFYGEEILGLHLTDSFSHPRFRWALGGKTGLFVRTGWIFLRTFLEEIDLPAEPLATDLPKARLAYGFPGERHFRLGVRLMKYRRHEPGVLYLTAEGAKGRRRPGLVEEDLTAFTEWPRLEEVFSPWRDKVFGVERRAAFLRWRFSWPGKEYRIFYTKTFWRKKTKAWLIAGPAESRWRVLDFWAREEEDLVELLQGVLARVPTGLEVWVAGNHPLANAFEKAGFRRAQEPLGIVPCTRCYFAGRRVPPEAADGFFFTMADADLF